MLDPLTAITRSKSLSAVTKQTYLQRLRALQAHFDEPLTDLVRKQPARPIQWIQQTYRRSDQSQKGYFAAVLAVFKHCPALKDRAKPAHKAWLTAFEQADASIQERYSTNKPSVQQQKGYVEWPEVVKARNRLPRGSKERLLLSMVSMIPPLRSDFNAIAIVRCGTPAEQLVDSVRVPNFLVLPPAVSRPATLVLNEYKTAKHADRAFVKELPLHLTLEIRRSLQLEPRAWLFVDRDGQPYKPEAFSLYACRTLRKVFGKPVTLTILRHSYVNHADFNVMSIKDRRTLAQSMCHSLQTQEQYRWILPKKRGAPATGQVPVRAGGRLAGRQPS